MCGCLLKSNGIQNQLGSRGPAYFHFLYWVLLYSVQLVVTLLKCSFILCSVSTEADAEAIGQVPIAGSSDSEFCFINVAG